MNKELPAPFLRAVRELSRLPGLGERSAERLVFYLLHQPASMTRELSASLEALIQEIRECRQCHHLTHDDLCSFCSDEKRDTSLICVVEMPQDLLRLDESCDYPGLFHVLGGRYAPLEGIFPEDLNIDSLERRIKHQNFKEVLLALSPNAEGEATAELIKSRIQSYGIKITRLATGLPQGSEIGWVGRRALQDAFLYRREA